MGFPIDIELEEKEYQVFEKKYLNIYESLEASAKRYRDKVCLIDDNGNITYEQLLLKVDLMAFYLKEEYKVKKGDRVGLLFVNSIEFCIAIYALGKIGAIAMMVNTKLKKQDIQYLIEDTGTKTLIMNEIWWDKVEELVEKGIVTQIIFDKNPPIWAAISPKIEEFEKIFFKMVNAPIKIIQVEKELSNPMIIMHTSGTTGKPKGVMVSHRNILEAAYGYERRLNLTHKDTSVLSVPMFHILGFSCVTTLFLYIGGTLVLSSYYNTNEVLRKIKKYKATHFHSVPAVYIKLTQAYLEHRDDLSSLKIAVCGGAIISKENSKQFCQIAPNASFRIAYGMTETAGSGALSTAHMEPAKALENVGIKVVDENLEEVARGKLGQVIFTGPIVTRAFWKGEKVVQGHLQSGDIAYMDSADHLYLVDRLKDMINRGGEKIAPSKIETILLQCPNVEGACVFAVEDPVLGEVPGAVVVSKDHINLDLQYLKSYVKERLAKYENPKFIHQWDQLPITENGKVRKTELRDYYNSKNQIKEFV